MLTIRIFPAFLLHIATFATFAFGNNSAFEKIIESFKKKRISTAQCLLRLTEKLTLSDLSDGYGNFNEKFYYRPGGILGSNSNWIRTLKNKKTIITLSNTNATNLFELSEKLYLIGIGKK